MTNKFTTAFPKMDKCVNDFFDYADEWVDEQKVKEYAKKLQILFPPDLADFIAREHYRKFK